MPVGDGIDAADPRFKNELTKDAAPMDTPPPPPPDVTCARELADASNPGLFAGVSAVIGVLFVRRSPSTSTICSPLRAVGTAETIAATAFAPDTGGAVVDDGVVPSIDGLTPADGATAVVAAAGGSVSEVAEAVASAEAGTCVARAAAAKGLLHRTLSA